MHIVVHGSWQQVRFWASHTHRYTYVWTVTHAWHTHVHTHVHTRSHTHVHTSLCISKLTSNEHSVTIPFPHNPYLSCICLNSLSRILISKLIKPRKDFKSLNTTFSRKHGRKMVAKFVFSFTNSTTICTLLYNLLLFKW